MTVGELKYVRRLPLLALGLASLFLGVYGGLARMNLVPTPSLHILLNHGSLMICGFIATLIALERYVVLRGWWSIPSYLLLGVGGLLVAAGLVYEGRILWILGAASFLAVHLWLLVRLRFAYPHILMVAASILLLLGNIRLYVGETLSLVTESWTGFLILFIMGERVEMARVGGFLFPASLGVIASTLLFIASTFLSPGSNIMAAAATLALIVSVVGYDVGLRFLRGWGFQRFLSSGLTIAYIWLALGGLLWLLTGYSDSSYHSIFIGFAGTMIMTHAPVTIPAMIRTRHIYSKHLYIPLTLLQVSTLMRIVGSLLPSGQLWAMSGLLTTVSIAGYIIIMVRNLVGGIRR